MPARNNIRYKCHVVCTLSNRDSVIVPTEGRNGSNSPPVVHTGPRSAQKSMGNPARRREKRPRTQRTANLQWLNTHVCKGSTGNRTGSDRLWCYQNNGVVEGTGRSGTHECAKSRVYSVFSGHNKEDMVHLLQIEKENRAKERSQST